MPPPPLVQQPHVQMMMQQQQDDRQTQPRLQPQSLAAQQPPQQQRQQAYSRSHDQPSPSPPPGHGALLEPTNLRNDEVSGAYQPPLGPGGFSAAPYPCTSAAFAEEEGDDETASDGSMISRGASFDRGRGFSGKSLSLRAGGGQWASRPRPGGGSHPAQITSRGTFMPSSSAGERTRPAAQPASSQASLSGAGTPAQPLVLKAQQPPLKRRPYLPVAAGADASAAGDESPCGGPGHAHATPFAELIARRGSDVNMASLGSGLGSSGLGGTGALTSGESNGVEHGLAAGLELLVSHVRRATGSSGADGAGQHDAPHADMRFKASPVAGATP